METMKLQKRVPVSAMLDPKIVFPAIGSAFAKLDPRLMIKNPVMFVVELGSVLTTILLLKNIVTHTGDFRFDLQITLWLWFTVLFANFAEAMAEGRGKAQADALRQAKSETTAYRVNKDGGAEEIPSSQLRLNDVVRVSAGQMIPGDGEVTQGVASVDESAITGESAPVIREAGGDRSAVTGGTRVLSDVITVRITSNPGETFLDRMIALVEGAERQKTPNEIALNILLAGLTIIFLLAVVTLQPFAQYSGAPQTVFVLISLLVCLIPTTIGGLLSAIGIAGMDRLVQHNVLATSGRAASIGVSSGARRFRGPVGGCGTTLLPSRRNARRPIHRGAGKRALQPAGPRTGPDERGVRAIFCDHAHERDRSRRPQHSQRSRRCYRASYAEAWRCAARRGSCRGPRSCQQRRHAVGGG